MVRVSLLGVILVHPAESSPTAIIMRSSRDSIARDIARTACLLRRNLFLSERRIDRERRRSARDNSTTDVRGVEPWLRNTTETSRCLERAYPGRAGARTQWGGLPPFVSVLGVGRPHVGARHGASAAARSRRVTDARVSLRL